MALPTINGLELFSGVGMLGEGLRAGLGYLGLAYRTVCHVEREAHAASVLVARMAEGSLDEAPIWSDVTTFDGRRWRGTVDCVVAGFPCQDLSIAGKRAGLDGARSGLFFEVLRIADDCGAWFILLENVAGIATATATVVDEEEGELEERAAARVLGELADRGWNAEWLTLSAADVGASHGRARWFCVAWRRMGHAGLQHLDVQQRANGPEHPRASDELGDGRRERRPELQGRSRRSDIGRTGGEVADAASDNEIRRFGLRAAPETGCEPWPMRHGESMADAYYPLPQRGGECDDATGRQEPNGHARLEGRELFAPGPGDHRWADIIERSPWLAPALESNFRMLAHGLAFDMGDSRAARLRCVGNGVVALCAAAAVVELVRRSGIMNLNDMAIRRAAAVISFEALHEAQEALETIAQFDGAHAGEEGKESRHD